MCQLGLSVRVEWETQAKHPDWPAITSSSAQGYQLTRLIESEFLGSSHLYLKVLLEIPICGQSSNLPWKAWRKWRTAADAPVLQIGEQQGSSLGVLTLIHPETVTKGLTSFSLLRCYYSFQVSFAIIDYVLYFGPPTLHSPFNCGKRRQSCVEDCLLWSLMKGFFTWIQVFSEILTDNNLFSIESQIIFSYDITNLFKMFIKLYLQSLLTNGLAESIHILQGALSYL